MGEKSFKLRYRDHDYVVRLHELLGADMVLRPDEWVILSGDKLIAALPHLEGESRDKLETRVLSVLSGRIK